MAHTDIAASVTEAGDRLSTALALTLHRNRLDLAAAAASFRELLTSSADTITITASNDRLDFEYQAFYSSFKKKKTYTANISHGDYPPEELASELQTRMRSSTTPDNTKITVEFV